MSESSWPTEEHEPLDLFPITPAVRESFFELTETRDDLTDELKQEMGMMHPELAEACHRLVIECDVPPGKEETFIHGCLLGYQICMVQASETYDVLPDVNPVVLLDYLRELNERWPSMSDYRQAQLEWIGADDEQYGVAIGGYLAQNEGMFDEDDKYVFTFGAVATYDLIRRNIEQRLES